jgi:hypothetical protein
VELLAILDNPTFADASMALARQLIAAKLNVANGSNPATAQAAIAYADVVLSSYGGKLPYNVAPASGPGQSMVALASVLEAYNNVCESLSVTSPGLASPPISDVRGGPPSGLPGAGLLDYVEKRSTTWYTLLLVGLLLAGCGAFAGLRRRRN